MVGLGRFGKDYQLIMMTEKGISILAEDTQEALKKILDFLKDECGDMMVNIDVLTAMKLLEGLIDKEEEYCGHRCTGECQETKECPCVNEHLCKNGVIIQE